MADQYKADMKKWKADKIKDPDAPRPPRLSVRVRKTNIASQEAAKNYCDKFQEELDKKNEGKDTKDTKTDKPKRPARAGDLSADRRAPAGPLSLRERVRVRANRRETQPSP